MKRLAGRRQKYINFNWIGFISMYHFNIFLFSFQVHFNLCVNLLLQIWRDENLTWDPKSYEDIAELNIGSSLTWRPEIVILK